MLASRLVSDARDLIDRFGRGDEKAWPDFLGEYAPLLLQAAREVERDADAAGDAFLFVCQRLAADGCRRLRQFDPSGHASFPTWLRVVAWNLALDARRQRLGRFRPLAAIRRLPVLQQRIYRLRYEERLSSDQAFAMLQPEFPGLSREDASRAEADVDQAMGSKARWMLEVRRPVVESLDAPIDDGETLRHEPADHTHDPESAAITADERERLGGAIAALDPADRLLVQLRFDEGMTLATLARVLEFKDQWTVVRQLQRVLKQLRAALGAKGPSGSV